ncbi:MAG: GlsB/YeaQ/YmgE family stress response membrane protein [Actinomycetota bacterium]|nr:GlsB/YeaQ/YmgE family stress response membrane protein [Actinomycetota bacterium]
MQILYFILIGLVVGVLARLLLPGRDPVGLIGTILVGIVGAVVGGYLWRELFGDTEGVEWIGAIVTSMILLYLYRRFALGRSGSRTV